MKKTNDSLKKTVSKIAGASVKSERKSGSQPKSFPRATSAPETHSDYFQLAPQELLSFRTFLLSQKSAILNRSQEFQRRQQIGRESGADEAELASAEVSESVSIHLYERDRGLLFQIERALSRITLGTFGKCESCNEAIGLRRLRVRPFSTLCVECTEEKEDTH